MDLPRLPRPSLAIPSYPPAQVPPTANNPFNALHSSQPEGSVFIVIGSILGLFAVVLLAWRMCWAYTIHRSAPKESRQVPRTGSLVHLHDLAPQRRPTDLYYSPITAMGQQERRRYPREMASWPSASCPSARVPSTYLDHLLDPCSQTRF